MERGVCLFLVYGRRCMALFEARQKNQFWYFYLSNLGKSTPLIPIAIGSVVVGLCALRGSCCCRSLGTLLLVYYFIYMLSGIISLIASYIHKQKRLARTPTTYKKKLCNLCSKFKFFIPCFLFLAHYSTKQA